MECNRRVFLSSVFLAMIIFAGRIYAQENSADSANYHIEGANKRKPKFIQTLSWSKMQYIDTYNIEIQKNDGGNFHTVYKTSTPETSIDVSLEPGEYQFQICVEDFLGRQIKSPWQPFEVLQAFNPKIKSVYPTTFYLGAASAEGIFTISGENFLETSEFKLSRIGEEQEVVGTILSIDEGDGIKTTAKVQFPITELAANSSYSLLVQNPGGLSTMYSKIQIKEGEKIVVQRDGIVQISAGYTLPITLYDQTLYSYTEKKIYPISALAKFSVLPLRTKAGNFGVCLDATYSMIKADTSNYKLSAHYINALFNIVYQKFIIPNKLSFDLHGGAGIGMLLGMKLEYSTLNFSSPSLSSMGIAFGGGFAVQFFPIKHLYIEAGADFIHTKFSDMNIGAIYPSVSIGGLF